MTDIRRLSNKRKIQEYVFSLEDRVNYPSLWRLLQRGYNFVLLVENSGDFNRPTKLFRLAYESTCSNGSELRKSFEHLTAGHSQLADLEHFVACNMLHILQKHFFGKNRVVPFKP